VNSIILQTTSGQFLTTYSIIFTIVLLAVLLAKFVFSIVILVIDKKPREMRRELNQGKLIITLTLEMLVLNKMYLWSGFDFTSAELKYSGT
jgi:hypothetical protein